MKSQDQTLSDVLKSAQSIWNKSGIDMQDDAMFQEVGNDPIVRLLLSALLHQTNVLETSIEDFESQVVAQYIANTLPFHLVQPIPSFAIMQTYKVRSDDDEGPCHVDQECSFEITPTTRHTGKKIHFVPLVRTKIIAAEVVSVRKTDDGKYTVLLKSDKALNDLSYVAFCFPTIPHSAIVSISSGNSRLPVITPEQYDRLPYIDIFKNSIRFYNNSLQYGVFAHLQELLPRYAMNYCLIDRYDAANLPLQFDGDCIALQFEFTNPSSIRQFGSDDIHINCFPAINIDITPTTLSQQTPIRKIDLQDAFLLTVGSVSNYSDNDDIVAIRQINTERFTQTELFSLFRNLVNKFNAEYYLFKEVIDKKTENAIQQVIMLIDNACKNQASGENDTYLMLRHPVPNTIGVEYVTTLGAKANAINPDVCQITSSSSLFDPKRTRLLMPTIGGKDEVADRVRIGKLAKYYTLTNDRIVSRSDIVHFCKKELQLSFNYPDEAIERISVDKVIRPDALPHILVEIVVNEHHDDCERIEETLENLIQSKTTSVFPIKVSIVLNEK